MSEDRKYSKEHEWISAGGETRKVGISEYAQEELGDVVFVELPEPGASFSKGDSLCSIESVKAVSDVYAPAACEVVKVNESLNDSPEAINESPFDQGWIAEVTLKDDSELGELMNAEQYASYVEEISK